MKRKTFASSNNQGHASAMDLSACCNPTSTGARGLLGTTASQQRTQDDASSSSSTSGEQLLIQDMNNLTLDERNKAYEELHGVFPEILETPPLVQNGLAKMKDLLSKRRRTAGAMEKVAFLVPHRLEDEAFLLAFLRCEQYNAEQAVQRLRNFFDYSFEFFGMDGLLRNVCLRDLNEGDMAFLRLGSMQPMVNATDRAGRPILIIFNHYAHFKEVSEMAKVYFYLAMQAIQLEAAQTKGLVMIAWQIISGRQRHLPPPPPPTPALLRAGKAFYSCMPFRISAFHVCLDDRSMLPIIEFVKLVVGRHARVRFRTHCGSFLECQYSLMTFGIDVRQFPLDPHHTIMDPRPFLEWIESVQQTEEQEQDGDAIQVPRSTDILLGRGQPFRQFPGNLFLSQVVVARKWEAYAALGRHEKQSFVQEVAHTLMVNHGIRFWKRQSKHHPWEMVSWERAVEKVSHAFRNKPVIERYHQSKDVDQQQLQRAWEEYEDDDEGFVG